MNFAWIVDKLIEKYIEKKNKCHGDLLNAVQATEDVYKYQMFAILFTLMAIIKILIITYIMCNV
jgi:hypothetical protein